MYAEDCQLRTCNEPIYFRLAIWRLIFDLEIARRDPKINIEKCPVFHVATQVVLKKLNDFVRVILEDWPLTVCETVKTLGVVLKSRFTLSDHVTLCIFSSFG